MQFNPFEQKIINLLKPYATHALSREITDANWTKEMREILGDFGIKSGFKVCATGFNKKFSAEWLFDMVWYHTDVDDHLTEIGLVMESEWSASLDNIWYDFEKLLVSKCKHKLFIFQCSSKNTQAYLNYMKKAIDNFYPAVANERYLFVAFDWGKQDFVFDLKVTK